MPQITKPEALAIIREIEDAINGLVETNHDLLMRFPSSNVPTHWGLIVESNDKLMEKLAEEAARMQRIVDA